MDRILSFIDASYDRIMQELAEFIAIPSVSTRDENRGDVLRCSQWLADHMTAMGIASEVMATERHPVVCGQWLGAPGRPTLLVYGHYDVQPAEPLDLWESPPFQMSEREGFLFARGISDDKGQLFIHLKAAEAFLKTRGALPVNVKFMLEGEEEIGSPSLTRFLEENRDRLRADVAVISDNPMLGRGLPAVGYGLRGLAYGEVVLHGPRGDLHSGRFGGAVDNPANVLCRIVAALRDERGRVTIPGFYDAVRPMADEERDEIAGLPVGEAFYLEASGAPALAPEEGYGPIECIWARPTMDVCGLASGFQGQGAKTIIPSSARAKISFRLVPDQDPKDVLDGLEARLKELCPPSVTMELIRHEGAYPAMVDRGDPALKTARAALEEGFGKPCYLIRQGGTIPVVSQLRKVLGLGTLLLGFGLPDENAHAPNEKLLIENFRGGMRSIAALYEMLGRGQGPERSVTCLD
jgi:acetylornithine deacetylase/succinyl-diaminopimelate desuccinylase-like protein